MIICIGISVFDIIFDTSYKLEENKKNQASNIRFNIGGNAINVCKALKHFGLDVELVSEFADDEFGKIIYNELSSLGIHASFSKDVKLTSVSAIVNNTSNGSRTILNYKNSSSPLSKISLPDTCSAIYSDGRFSQYTEICRKKFPNIAIVWDWERVEHFKNNKKIISKNDILICSEDFINEMLGFEEYGKSEEDIIKYLYDELYFNAIAVTKGSKGFSYSSFSDRSIKNIAAIDVHVVDTNAAGDVFHASFINNYLKTNKLEYSLIEANKLTSKFVSKKGFFEALD